MKKSLQNTFFRSLVVLFTIALIGTIILNSTLSYISFSSQKEKIKENIINSKKEILRNQVEFMISDIDSSREKLQTNIKKDLQTIVETAYNIAQNLYLTQKNNPDIQNIIIESLRKLKFFDIEEQYVFMTKLDGTFLLVDGVKHLEGKNVFDTTIASNHKSIRSNIEMVRAQKEGFSEYLWQDHISLKFEKKLSYLKYFEPFDCYIGTGIFFKDIENKLKENFLERIDTYRFGENRQYYMFAASYEGYSLTNPAKGKYVYDVEDTNGIKVVQEFIKLAKNGGGYLRYHLPIGDRLGEEKLSYVTEVPLWDFYLGTGETLKDIDKVIDEKKQELLDDLSADIVVMILLGFFFLILFYIFFTKIKKSLTKDIDYIIQSLEKIITTNETIDTKAIKFEEFYKLSNFINELFHKKSILEKELKEKELIFYQQSKLAAMGEMLENIAHQWRQPLTMITISSSSVVVKHEEGILDDKFLIESLEHITQNAEYLSNTIEDFRTFFIKDKIQESFKIDEPIQKALTLLKNRIIKQDVNIISNLLEIEIISFKNELLQVYLVILNNSLDALKKIEKEKYIFIDTYLDDDMIQIEFKDNAGGVQKEYLHKVFEPYFTTKHKSQGTGIGLYMAKEIIEKHLNGSITIVNDTFIYEKNQYTGAKLVISFPIS